MALSRHHLESDLTEPIGWTLIGFVSFRKNFLVRFLAHGTSRKSRISYEPYITYLIWEVNRKSQKILLSFPGLSENTTNTAQG